MSSGNRDKAPVPRHKVFVKPGRTLSDWMVYKNRIPRQAIGPVPKEELAKHASREDCWIAIQGKVFDVTAYLDYHPGGPEQILAYAGTDASGPFQDHHAWVNYDNLLDSCLKGFLVS